MRRSLALSLTTLALLVPAAAAQEPVTATFYGEPGLQVEILGLERWSPAMIRDSLAIHARGQSFTSRDLAAALKEQLGFPDAVAIRQQSGDSAVNILLAVIEPQDSARVRLRALGTDSTRSLAPWPSLVELARTRLELIAAAAAAQVRARAVSLPAAVPLSFRPDSVAVRRVWAMLDAHRTPRDAAAAHRLLTAAPNVDDRLAAVAILTAFDRDDATWHALVGALRDPDERVRGFASAVLRTFVAEMPRRVDWRPAVADLHAILNGTALSALHGVLDALMTTDVSPELAGPLLRDGGHAVLLYAGSTNPAIRIPIYRFLRAMSGEDRGGIPARWHAWIADL